MINKYNTKIKKKVTARFVRIVISMLILSFALTLLLPSCGSKRYPADSLYVRVDGEKKVISAEIPVDEDVDKDNVYLFALDMWQSETELGSITPLAKARVTGDVARAEVKTGEQMAEMLCRGYLFAEKDADGDYSAITGRYYVSNPANAGPKAEDKGKTGRPTKGIIGSVSHILELNAGATVVTVDIGGLMKLSGGEDSIPYIWNGITYYADRKKVEALDKKIGDYSDSGIYVYLEIVQTSTRASLEGRLKDIVFDAPEGKKGYALNMTTRDGASRISGMFDFLAERYGKSGQAPAFIIGRKVNNMNDWYAGGPTAEKGVANYLSAVRSAYNILLSHNSEGRVYIAVDNNWVIAEPGNLPVKELLSSFNNLCASQGDFFWQVSAEANTSDLSDSSIWDDPLSTGRSDFLSPANIEMLTNQLSADLYRFEGGVRHMLLNRFTVGGNDEEARAASYAYAYYKCLDSGITDGLIYGQMHDGEDGSSTSGLYTAESDGVFPQPKKIALILRDIDDKNGETADFVSDLIGAKWDHLYRKFKDEVDHRTTYYGEGGSNHSNSDRESLADFRNGNDFGFRAAASGRYTELRYSEEWKRPVLYAYLDPLCPSDKSGVVSSGIDAEILRQTGYLGIISLVDATDSRAELSVRLSGLDSKGNEVVYMASAQVNTNSWVDVYFDIDDFIGDVECDTVSIAVLTRPLDTHSSILGLSLAGVVSEAPDKGEFPVWIIVVLIIAAAGAAITGFVYWFKKNYTFVRE